MKEDNAVEIEGIVKEALRGKFKVEISQNDKPSIVLAYLSGALKKNFIRVVEGDKVKVEVSPYDMTIGRIVYRVK